MCKCVHEALLDFFLIQDGTKVFTASCDKMAKMWDLNSNQSIQVAQVGVCLLGNFIKK